MGNVPTSTIGEILRKAREEQNLSLEAVHHHTKISIEVLQALEQDDIDMLGSETYLKGFVRNYARFLKLDTDLALAALDRQRGRAHTGRGTLWDIEETLSEERLKAPRILSRIILPLLLIAVLILSFLLVKEHKRVKTLRADKRIGYLQVKVD